MSPNDPHFPPLPPPPCCPPHPSAPLCPTALSRQPDLRCQPSHGVRAGYSLGAAPALRPPLASPPQRLLRNKRRLPENGPDTQAVAASLLLPAPLRQPARPRSVAAEIGLALRHVTRPPPFPPRRRLRGPASPPPGAPSPSFPKPHRKGRPGALRKAPGSGASPLLTAESGGLTAPAQPPGRPRARRGAVTRPLPFTSRPRIIPSRSPRGPSAQGGEPAPRYSPRPRSGAAPPQDQAEPGWPRKSRRVGVCGRARTRCAPGRDASSPGQPPPLGSAAPPAAPWPRGQPHPPAAASPQPSPRCGHPRPHLSCGCSGESGDGGGQARASSPRSASRPPPSYSHTPPPGAASFQARGAAREGSPGRREQREEAGRPTPPSQPPSARRPQQVCSWTRTQHALRARAHRAHLPAVCRMRPGGGGVGAARLVRPQFCSVDAGAGASWRAAWKNPALPPYI